LFSASSIFVINALFPPALDVSAFEKQVMHLLLERANVLLYARINIELAL